MNQKIVIIGAGQHARVVLYNAKCQGIYEPIGFFDGVPDHVGEERLGLPVLACYEGQDLKQLAKTYGTNLFFIGFGNMHHRREVYQRFTAAGWEAVNIIHPDAVVSDEAVLGKGILIECGCLITPNPVIGDNVVVNTGSQVNHDNVVESHVYIASGVILSGGVTIRENTLLDDGVIVTLGRSVGRDCIIGAGAIVTKNIPDGKVAYGSPAKVIRENI